MDELAVMLVLALILLYDEYRTKKKQTKLLATLINYYFPSMPDEYGNSPRSDAVRHVAKYVNGVYKEDNENWAKDWNRAMDDEKLMSRALSDGFYFTDHEMEKFQETIKKIDEKSGRKYV